MKNQILGDICVANIKSRSVSLNSPNVFYVGQENSFYQVKTSLLQNPYTIGKDGDCAEVIEKFRVKLWESVCLWLETGKHEDCEDVEKQNKMFAGLVPVIKQVVLGENVQLVCWCSPEPCHGDVIAKCVKWFIDTHKKELGFPCGMCLSCKSEIAIAGLDYCRCSNKNCGWVNTETSVIFGVKFGVKNEQKT